MLPTSTIYARARFKGTGSVLRSRDHVQSTQNHQYPRHHPTAQKKGQCRRPVRIHQRSIGELQRRRAQNNRAQRACRAWRTQRICTLQEQLAEAYTVNQHLKRVLCRIYLEAARIELSRLAAYQLELLKTMRNRRV